MKLDRAPSLSGLKPQLERVLELAAKKVAGLDRSWDPGKGTPVFTVEGKYTTRGWTEWTQGFQYGMAVLEFDATREKRFLELGRERIIERMAPHVSHIGVHDHGFNNVSTYGNLRRLMREGVIAHNPRELDFYELALKVSGAVQAARWTAIPSDAAAAPTNRDTGYIYSFNGPHSLFSDTIRSVRALMLSWQLGHCLMGENDRAINLLHRGLHHGLSTAKYNVYYGAGRDTWDTPAESGRVVHESIFNTVDGRYRCASTQQGYSPFSTWTRGLAWVLCGYAEELEFLGTVSEADLKGFALGNKKSIVAAFLKAATASADWYLAHSFADGMVYWDAGAAALPRPVDYSAPSDPYNDHEPIDSSAAAISAHGFYRLSKYLAKSDPARARKYEQAALVIAQTLFAEPYLSTDAKHQGLILHSIYHRPNGWDFVPQGAKIPCGESSMWGDYHALDLANLLYRAATKRPYITFFDR